MLQPEVFIPETRFQFSLRHVAPLRSLIERASGSAVEVMDAVLEELDVNDSVATAALIWALSGAPGYDSKRARFEKALRDWIPDTAEGPTLGVRGANFYTTDEDDCVWKPCDISMPVWWGMIPFTVGFRSADEVPASEIFRAVAKYQRDHQRYYSNESLVAHVLSKYV